MISSNFYTYAYLRKRDNTPYYIGKGNGRRAFVKHEGISVPKDRSKIIFLKQNLTEEEAFKHEIYMISIFGRKDLGTGILLNRTNGGEGTSGLALTEEQKEKCREAGKIGGKIGGKISGNKHKENKTGVFGLSLEEKREIGKKTYACGVGVHGLSKEELSEAGKRGGKVAYENGSGFHSLAEEEKNKNCSKGGKIGGPKGIKVTNSQKWQCTVTGYISPSSGLTHYQKALGIDTSNRIKVDGPRIWEITFEDGRVVVTTQTLKAWAKENGYSYDGVLRVRGNRSLNYKSIIKVVCL